jgi:hypothetical protein
MMEVYAKQELIDLFKNEFKKIDVIHVRFVDREELDCFYQFYVEINKVKTIILVKPDSVSIEYKNCAIHTNIIPVNLLSDFPWDVEDDACFVDMAFTILYTLEEIGFEGAVYDDFEEYWKVVNES